MSQQSHSCMSFSPEAKERRGKENQAKLAQSFLLAGRWDLAEKLEKCGQFFSGFFSPVCGCGTAVPIHCGVRGCNDCEKRRGSRLYKIVRRLFEEMTGARFMTLTVANVKEMDPGVIDSLRAAFVKLRHKKRFKRYVKGGFLRY